MSKTKRKSPKTKSPNTKRKEPPTTPKNSKKSKDIVSPLEIPITAGPRYVTSPYNLTIQKPLVEEGIKTKKENIAVDGLLSLIQNPKKGGKTRRKSLKKLKKRGGGTTQSKNNDIPYDKKKIAIREEIEEVKAALAPQFDRIESIERLNSGEYRDSDLENIKYMQDKIKLDEGMSNRLVELYEELIKLEDECHDNKKGGKKSKKTKRRRPRN